MPRLIRETLVTVRELALAWGPFALIVVPLSYADELYALRQHIDLVRIKLG